MCWTVTKWSSLETCLQTFRWINVDTDLTHINSNWSDIRKYITHMKHEKLDSSTSVLNSNQQCSNETFLGIKIWTSDFWIHRAIMRPSELYHLPNKLHIITIKKPMENMKTLISKITIITVIITILTIYLVYPWNKSKLVLVFFICGTLLVIPILLYQIISKRFPLISLLWLFSINISRTNLLTISILRWYLQS
jgi:hypothetical protein